MAACDPQPCRVHALRRAHALCAGCNALVVPPSALLQIALLAARKYRDVDGDGVMDREMLTIMLQCDSSSPSREQVARLRRLAGGGVQPADL